MKTYKFRINGNEYNVEINSVEGNIADVTVNGADYKVEMDASTSSVSGARKNNNVVAEPVEATKTAGASTSSATAVVFSVIVSASIGSATAGEFLAIAVGGH